MLFSSISFLYYFLPIVILLYFIVPFKFKNFILLLTSLFFYAWGEPVYVITMIDVSLIGWASGIYVDKFRGKWDSKFFTVFAVVVSLWALGIFKYADFAIENINAIFKKI